MKRTLALLIVGGLMLTGCSSSDSVDPEEAPAADVSAEETVEKPAEPLLLADGPTYDTLEELAEVVRGAGYACEGVTEHTVTEDRETYVSRMAELSPDLDEDFFNSSYDRETVAISAVGVCYEFEENGQMKTTMGLTLCESVEERDARFEQIPSSHLVYGPNWSLNFPLGSFDVDAPQEEHDEYFEAQREEMEAFADVVGAHYFGGSTQ